MKRSKLDLVKFELIERFGYIVHAYTYELKQGANISLKILRKSLDHTIELKIHDYNKKGQELPGRLLVERNESQVRLWVPADLDSEGRLQVRWDIAVCPEVSPKLAK